MHSHSKELVPFLVESFVEAFPLVPILLVLYFVLEILSHKRGFSLISHTHIAGALGPVAGTLLGLIPQCGMSVFVTSLYVSNRVTLGTLIATYLATSDEALPVLLAHGKIEMAMLLLIVSKTVVGISAGYLIDFFTKNKYYGKEVYPLKAAVAAEVTMELVSTKYVEIFKHSLQRTLRIFLWVLSITLVLGFIINFTPFEQFVKESHIPAFLMIPIVSIFGLIPNCAASVAIAEAYIHQVIPFGAALAGLSAGAGYGPIVLLKDGDRRTGVKIMMLVLAISIMVGWIASLLPV